jgi:hypothetical protein
LYILFFKYLERKQEDKKILKSMMAGIPQIWLALKFFVKEILILNGKHQLIFSIILLTVSINSVNFDK